MTISLQAYAQGIMQYKLLLINLEKEELGNLAIGDI